MHPVEYHYRAATLEHVSAMIDVHFASVHGISCEHYSDEILLAWSPVPDDKRKAWLSDVVASPATVSYVAESTDSEVLGFCLAVPEAGELKALYVHPKVSGCGLGKGLLQCLESHCRSLGLAELTLNASYNAEPFYRSNGYVALGPSVQVLGAEAMGAVTMLKSLRAVA
jgi:putative acetyltransferase